jgi:hypothetical protein
MGRPRKRQFIEAMENTAPDITLADADQIQLPVAVNDYGYPSNIAMSQPVYVDSQSGFGLPPKGNDLEVVQTDVHGDLLHFGDRMNFGNINFESNADQNIDPVFERMPIIQQPSTSISSESGSSPSSSAPLAPCSCLASMYLALASLQQLPTDIIVALKTVRKAAMTAGEVIWCPQCGAVLVEKPKPPIEAFQNTMLLGTLIPIIANAYKKLLDMIDAETEAATALGQTKTFKFHEYGGLCGTQESISGAMACIEKEMMFNAVEMPPLQWRTTVRALLRVDIYGHEQQGFKHRGLKSLVAEIEHRQRARHEWLDLHEDAGKMEVGHFGEMHCVGEKTHGCLQIMEMAKVAIDHLVIA